MAKYTGENATITITLADPMPSSDARELVNDLWQQFTGAATPVQAIEVEYQYGRLGIGKRRAQTGHR